MCKFIARSLRVLGTLAAFGSALSVVSTAHVVPATALPSAAIENVSVTASTFSAMSGTTLSSLVLAALLIVFAALTLWLERRHRRSTVDNSDHATGDDGTAT